MTTDHLGMAMLSRSACFDLLRGQTVGRLAVVDHGRPEIFPLNYVVDDEWIVFRTAAGTKLDAAVVAPDVAFEVDGLDEAAGEAWSVVVKGPASEIEGMYELVDALALPLFPWHAAPKHRFVRIEPREVTGRSFHVVEPAAWDDPARTSW
jgi:nitroimidazol reductase NimA-like FMN-containing flavoprotein (pyridoxamine 5'-phosphate oxidase superfamily)